MTQSREARDLFNASPAWPLDAALRAFAQFVKGAAGVWGNGADFDNPILAAAYRRLNMPLPWGAYAGRCYRTLKSLRPDIRLERQGTHHNALDDAVSQAEHAVRLLRALEPLPALTDEDYRQAGYQVSGWDHTADARRVIDWYEARRECIPRDASRQVQPAPEFHGALK